MKSIYYKFILLVFIPIFLSAFTCDAYPDFEDENHHYKIYFENNWDKKIRIVSNWYWNYYPCKMDVSYETIWRYDNEGVIIPPEGINGEYMKHDGFYESWVKDGDSLSVAIFEAVRVNENDSLHLLVSYALSLENLQKANFHLTYPPKEEMKDFHMWPTFKEVIERSRSFCK